MKLNNVGFEYLEATSTYGFEIGRSAGEYNSVNLEDIARTTNLEVDHTASEQTTVDADQWTGDLECQSGIICVNIPDQFRGFT